MTISSPALLDPSRSTPDVAEQRARTRAIVAPRTGERGLDIGCGFGLLACELARDVGPTGRVMGVDAVPDMIIACEERARHDAVTGRTEFRQADPEAVPASTGSFDFVTAIQVYEYMADVERGLAEAYRVLKPRGRLAVLDTDWESCVWHTDDRDRTARVLRVWEQRFAHPHLPARLPELLRRSGFVVKGVTLIPVINVEMSEHTYSPGMIDVVTRFVANRGGISEDEAARWAEDVRSQAPRGEYFFSLSRYLFLAERARTPRGDAA
ncbi:MAG: methyltransferase domain-containing protein [Candidatus Rokuibacteriota bacterium]